MGHDNDFNIMKETSNYYSTILNIIYFVNACDGHVIYDCARFFVMVMKNCFNTVNDKLCALGPLIIY